MRQVVDSVFRGLFLILLGLVFFANMYGFLPWNFWINVVDLWPMLLIFAGVALFFNKRIPFSAVMVIFLLALVGYSFVQGSPSFDNRMPLVKGTEQILALDSPLDSDVKKADLTLNIGGVAMNVSGVSGASNPGQLTNGTYEWKSRVNLDQPEFRYKKSGDTAKIVLNSEKRPSSNNRLELNLSDQVQYDNVELNAGAISGTMDFSRLQIDELNLNTGASDIELRFGDTGGKTKVDLNTGATKLNLLVPESVGLKINISGIASDTNFTGDGLILNSKDWISPNYEEAKTKIELDISMAAGKINLERVNSGVTASF